MAVRRHRTVNQPEQLGPDDDPYVAYLLWRAEREAAAAAEAPDDATAEPTGEPASGRSSWVRRLAVWHRNAAR